MYKKIFIFCFLFLYITSWVNAGSCWISEWPPKALKDYLKNNSTIIKNVTSEITKSYKWPDKEILTTLNENRVWMFNSFINWAWYWSYFKYFVSFPLVNDISKEVKRDYRLLENEWKWLNKFLETVSRKWYNIDIKDACKWIKSNCNLNWNALDIVGALIKNQSYVIDIYRKAVMWDEISGYELILVDNTNNKFVDDIIKYYWIWNNCVNSEDSFSAKVWEKIKSIWDYSNNYKDWVDKWKEAIALINWDNVTDEYEEELLTKELSRQWISWKKAAAIIWNLQRFNCSWDFDTSACTWWYSLDNNFVYNSFKHIWKQISDQISDFNKDVIQEFLNSNEGKETTSINSILGDSEKIEINLDIAESVSQIYNNELPFIEIWDKNTVLIRTDIINMHNNLNNAIKTLEKTIEIAEKVCNDQDTWNWMCTTD